MWTLILGLGASLFSIWITFRSFILLEIRIDEYTYKTLYEVCKNDRKFLFQEELTINDNSPLIFNAFCMFRGSPWFFISHGERLLTAGFQGKESVTIITCLRWNANKIKMFLSQKIKEIQLNNLAIPVQLLTPHYTDKIGSLKQLELNEPLLSPEKWQDIEKEVKEVSCGKRQKTSAILYGPPGNGKTSYIKYLALKYKLPIKIITLNPDYTNNDIIKMFSQIGSKCMVIFEDFDNYFDQRKPIIGGGNTNIKFSFDSILNGLDGVYNTYENVIFIMSVNDISKVDIALKNRPSRFKYIREFPNPDIKLRQQLIGEWKDKTSGLNLDQIMRLKEYKENKETLESAILKLKE